MSGDAVKPPVAAVGGSESGIVVEPVKKVERVADSAGVAGRVRISLVGDAIELMNELKPDDWRLNAKGRLESWRVEMGEGARRRGAETVASPPRSFSLGAGCDMMPSIGVAGAVSSTADSGAMGTRGPERAGSGEGEGPERARGRTVRHS